MKKKVMHPVRIYDDDWEKLKVKTKVDGLSFQKLTEVLLRGYLKNNKEIRRLVGDFVDKNGTRKSRSGLDDMEADELLRLIEEEHSPIRFIQEMSEDLKNEQ